MEPNQPELDAFRQHHLLDPMDPDAKFDNLPDIPTRHAHPVEILLPPPLPYEVPPPPDLSKLPRAIVHTGTVEMLLGQNEDLSARLTVNVRRNAILEAKLLEIEAQLQRAHEVERALEAQVQILKEKDRISQERKESDRFNSDSLNEKIAFLETKATALESANDNCRAQLNKLDRFQRRVRRWVAPFIEKLHASIGKLQNIIQNQARQIETKDAKINDLRSKLNTIGGEFEAKLKASEKDRIQIVEIYEQKLQKLNTDLATTKEKSSRVDQLTATETMIKNRLIFTERRCEELEKRLHTETGELQVEIARLREEAKILAMDRVQNERQIAFLAGQLKEQKDQAKSLQIEGENLRVLLRTLGQMPEILESPTPRPAVPESKPQVDAETAGS